MTSPQFQKRPCRPRDYLAEIGKVHPLAWQRADELRADRGHGLPDWPEWCYLPMAGWHAILSAEGSVADIARIAALGAWRVTQGIYRFDPALYADLMATPLDGEIPCEILYRIPEWCVYLETPDLSMPDGEPVHGVWAHLEDDHRHGHELRLLVDVDSQRWAIPIHLGKWPLADALQRAIDVARLPSARFADAARQQMQAIAGPVLSLLLYLCSQNAEIGEGSRRPANPDPKRTKRGWRLFPAERVTTWDVGVRLGAALRRAYHAAETAGDGTHAAPRGHIRRAHWHGFRSGPMKTAEGEAIPTQARRFDLRWLPPIAVNLDDVGDLPATVRPVKP